MRSIAILLASLSVAAVVGCSSSPSSDGSTATDAGTVLRPDASDGGDTGGGGGGGGGGGTTATDCGGIVTCLNGCPQGDQACGDACVSGGSAAAQSQFGALNTCLEQKCASAQTDAAFQQCASAQCGPQISACEGLGGGGGGGGGGGTGTCAALAQCLNGCSSNADQACIQACAGQASSAAIQAYQAIGTCAQQHGCTGANQQTCLQQNCSAEVQACLGN